MSLKTPEMKSTPHASLVPQQLPVESGRMAGREQRGRSPLARSSRARTPRSLSPRARCDRNAELNGLIKRNDHHFNASGTLA